MLCPICGSIVSLRSMDAKTRELRCPRCAKVSPLPPELAEALARESAAGEPLEALMAQADRIPGHAHFLDRDGENLIAYRWMKKGGLQILLLASLPIFLLMALALLFDSSLLERAFGIFTLVMIYFMLAVALNSTGVRLTDAALLIRNRPLPFLYAGSFARSQVRGARVVVGSDEDGAHYTVYIDRRGKRALVLGPAFRSGEEAKRIAETVTRWAAEKSVA